MKRIADYNKLFPKKGGFIRPQNISISSKSVKHI